MNEPSLGELARRLDQLYALVMRLLSTDVYTSDQRAIEHRFGGVERDIEEVRRQHADDIKSVMEEIKAISHQVSSRDQKQGEWRRQALYAGIIPAVLFALSTVVTIVLALRSSGK